MTWDKLVDRCLLFTDAPGGLLKELLKEAEIELSDKLMLFEALYKIKVPYTDYGLGEGSHDTVREHNYAKLPLNYLQDIGVTHKGTRLKKMTEDEIHRSTTGQTYTGTPTAYSISGNFIVFNSAPSRGDDFILHYKSRLTEETRNKIYTLQYYSAIGPTVYIDTPLGGLLDGKKLHFEGQVRTLSGGNNSGATISAGLPDTSFTNYLGALVAGESPDRIGSYYTLNSAFSAEGSLSGSEWSDAIGAMVTVLGVRDYQPLIPGQFHTSLCDYAIAIANAKSSPDIYNTYWTKWIMNMENLINESADRDLFHSVREEI
jgi:hypothetical protein